MGGNRFVAITFHATCICKQLAVVKGRSVSDRFLMRAGSEAPTWFRVQARLAAPLGSRETLDRRFERVEHRHLTEGDTDDRHFAHQGGVNSALLSPCAALVIVSLTWSKL